MRRGKPLTDCQKRFNKRIGRTRFKIERTFGSIKGKIKKLKKRVKTKFNPFETISYYIFAMNEIKYYHKGSDWNRWELHIHTPEAKKNDNFKGSTAEEKWDNFLITRLFLKSFFQKVLFFS